MSEGRPWRADLGAAAALLLLVWIACFFRLRELGLYEDDYWHLVPWQEGWPFLAERLNRLIGGGEASRPLAPFVIEFQFWLGWRLGGLDGGYALAGTVLFVNAMLVYALVRRLAGREIALVAAAFFFVYPGDATRMVQIRAFHAHLALAAPLIAFLLYPTRYRWLAYPISVLPLFFYEIGVVPFLFAPLLFERGWRALWRAQLRHGAVLGAWLAPALAVRVIFAPGRLRDVPADTAWQWLERSASAIWLGTAKSLELLVTRIGVVVDHADRFEIACMAGIFVVLSVGLWSMGRADRTDFGIPPPMERRDGIALIAAGVGMAALTYAMMITGRRFPPLFEFGRPTVVHAVGAIGYAIAIAGGLATLRRRAWPAGTRAGVVAGLALYLSVSAGFQLYVQRGLALSWAEQQRYWRVIDGLAGDLEDGSIIVLDMPSRAPTPVMRVKALGWSTVPTALHRYPEAWSATPVLILLEYASRYFRVENGRLDVRSRPYVDDYRPVEPRQVIWIEEHDGVLKVSVRP